MSGIGGTDKPLTWGAAVMALAYRYNGEYYDIPGQFRGIAQRGAFKGKALISLMGVKENFHVDLSRLWDIEDYMRRKAKGPALLPPGACGRLISDSPIESEGARGNLLSQILTGEGEKSDG